MFGLTMHDSCQACLLIPPGILLFPGFFPIDFDYIDCMIERTIWLLL
jgi:hypothetical protein